MTLYAKWDLTDVEITIRTGLKVGNYGTICLKKNLTSFSGATFFDISYIENEIIYLDEIEESELSAGKPYLFLAEDTEITGIYGSEVATVAGHNNGLYGSFSTEKLTGAYDYVIYQNQYRKAGANTSVGEHRAYIQLDKIGNEPVAPSPSRRRVAMGTQGSQVTTDIENVNNNDGQSPNVNVNKLMIDGNLYIIRNNRMYNVNGQLVK